MLIGVISQPLQDGGHEVNDAGIFVIGPDHVVEYLQFISVWQALEMLQAFRRLIKLKLASRTLFDKVLGGTREASRCAYWFSGSGWKR